MASEHLPPRPGDSRLGMTRLGALRDEYNASVEGRPTRFTREGDRYHLNPAYFEWCARADEWAEQRKETQ